MDIIMYIKEQEQLRNEKQAMDQKRKLMEDIEAFNNAPQGMLQIHLKGDDYRLSTTIRMTKKKYSGVRYIELTRGRRTHKLYESEMRYLMGYTFGDITEDGECFHYGTSDVGPRKQADLSIEIDINEEFLPIDLVSSSDFTTDVPNFLKIKRE